MALRFAVGMTLVSVICYALTLPLGYLTVLMTGKLLHTDKSYMSAKESIGLLLVVSASMYAALLISIVFIHYPLVFLLIITLVLLRVFYMAHKGAPDILVIMLLVASSVVPMLAMQSQALALTIVNWLVIATALALLFTLISFALLPGGGTNQPEIKEPSDQDAFEGAIKSLLVVMPVYMYVFVTNNPGALLVLIFVAIIAQNTSLDHGVKAGKGLLIGNLIGGLLGIFIYNLLVVIPSLGFFALLMALTWLLIGQQAFQPGLPGQLAGRVFPAINVVLSGALGYFSTDAADTVYLRLLQLGLVAVYVALAFSVVESVANWFTSREKRHVQTFR